MGLLTAAVIHYLHGDGGWLLLHWMVGDVVCTACAVSFRYPLNEARSAIIVPYCFNNSGVLANRWAMDLVRREHTERLEGSGGWFSFHGNRKLYVLSECTLMWLSIYYWRKVSSRCLAVVLSDLEFQSFISSPGDWLVQWKMATCRLVVMTCCGN